MPAVGKRKKAAFIKAIQSGQTVAAALRLVRVRREDIYAARFDDTAFKAAWDEAWTMGADALEDEAMRRAIDGVEKPVFRGGEVVGHVRDYSDSMLMFIGWVCGFALAWHFILYDLATWAQLAFLPDGPALPALNGTETLITVLLSMLGLGGLRTVEKIKGVARDNIAGGADK